MAENPSGAGESTKPVVEPVTEQTNEPRSGGPAGPGGASDSGNTRTGGEMTREEAQSIADREMSDYNRQVREGTASRYAAADVMARTAHEPPVYEVIVDSWGHTPEIKRGARVTPDDCPYDLAAAEARNIVRRLSIAEVRSQTPHPTMPLTVDGLAIDEALLLAGRFHAGFRSPAHTGTLSDPQGNPVTVTTRTDVPAMPPEFEKPTLPGPEGGAPAARPVITIDPGQDPRSAVEDYFAEQERSARGPQSEQQDAGSRRAPAKK